jgi:hypothetical protein
LTVVTLAGQSAVTVAAWFEGWRSAPDPVAVDRLCAVLREHASSLPVVYFSEWVDRWLMGDLVSGLGAIEGRRFQATCVSSTQAVAWADRCGNQFAEQGWLASRLREAAAGWGRMAEPYAVVVAREVVGASATDDDVEAATGSVPAWLSLDDEQAEPGATADRGAM